jgi:hypothetical protein
VGPPALTETTIRYLFASSWLPSNLEEPLARVPGGSTTGLDTGANLLHIAMWNLRRQGLMEFEQLRAVEDEPVRVFGGKSFARYRLIDSTVRMAGLEGALLAAARSVDQDREGRIDKAIHRGSGDDDHGVRRMIRALDLDHRAPWRTVCSHCFQEARAAGLVGVKGRIFKKVVITDPAALETLRPRHDELRAERGAYLEAEPELTKAAMSDCLRTVADAYNPGGAD